MTKKTTYQAIKTFEDAGDLTPRERELIRSGATFIRGKKVVPHETKMVEVKQVIVDEDAPLAENQELAEQPRERSFRPRRTEGGAPSGDRPFRSRRPEGEGAPTGERSFRPRRTEGGAPSSDRPYRSRRPEGESAPTGERSFRPRRTEGGAPSGDRPNRSFSRDRKPR